MKDPWYVVRYHADEPLVVRAESAVHARMLSIEKRGAEFGGEIDRIEGPFRKKPEPVDG